MTHPAATADAAWLKRYNTLRALVSAAWVALAATLGRGDPAFGVALALAYPAWDAVANGLDARRSGGLRANPAQALNVAISAAVTLAVAVAATRGIHAVIGVIGVWAALAGVSQLATALRRRGKVSAQWPMMLSGAQSALAGAHFVTQSLDPAQVLTVATVAPYAAFGAFYFALSALVLHLRRAG